MANVKHIKYIHYNTLYNMLKLLIPQSGGCINLIYCVTHKIYMIMELTNLLHNIRNHCLISFSFSVIFVQYCFYTFAALQILSLCL